MKKLSLQEFKKLREREKDDLAVINVLSKDAYDNGHIPETPNVPRDADDFVARVERIIGGKGHPVVVYCASDECDASPKAARTLEQAGFDEVYDFEGGTEAWKDAGERVVATT